MRNVYSGPLCSFELYGLLLFSKQNQNHTEFGGINILRLQNEREARIKHTAVPKWLRNNSYKCFINVALAAYSSTLNTSMAKSSAINMPKPERELQALLAHGVLLMLREKKTP